MSVLLGICAVVSTLCLAVVAYAILRVLRKFEIASDELTRTAEVVRSTASEANHLARRFGRIADELEPVIVPLKRATARLEDLGDRAVQLSNVVLDEVERPLRTTMAVLSGVRAGAHSLIGALTRRANQSQSNGGQSHE